MDTETLALCIMKYKLWRGLSYWVFLLVILPILPVRGGHTEPGRAAPQANSAFRLRDNFQQVPKSKCQCSRVKWDPLHKRSADEPVSPSLPLPVRRDAVLRQGWPVATGLTIARQAGSQMVRKSNLLPRQAISLPSSLIKNTYASFLRKVKHMLANG